MKIVTISEANLSSLVPIEWEKFTVSRKALKDRLSCRLSWVDVCQWRGGMSAEDVVESICRSLNYDNLGDNEKLPISRLCNRLLNLCRAFSDRTVIQGQGSLDRLRLCPGTYYQPAAAVPAATVPFARVYWRVEDVFGPAGRVFLDYLDIEEVR